jgi:DNA polymerase-3 subunit delta'
MTVTPPEGLVDPSVPYPSILGHAAQRRALWRAFHGGDRAPQAVLIQGLRGVGKSTLALAVARSLLCVGVKTLGPCETCASCRRASRGSHPDLAGILRNDVLGVAPDLIEAREERTSKGKDSLGAELTVDYAKALAHFVGEIAFEAKRRVVVIVEAERMNVAAANSLLKSLEEPAAQNVVILTSSSPERLLPTVRSRCATLRLTGVPAPEIERALVEGRFQAPMDGRAARARARLAGGSLRRALETEPEGTANARTLLLRALHEGDESALAGWLAAEALAALDGEGPQGREAALNLLGSALRDIASLRAGGGESDLALGSEPSTIEALRRIAASGLDPFAFWAHVADLSRRLAGQANPLLLWDSVLQVGGALAIDARTP